MERSEPTVDPDVAAAMRVMWRRVDQAEAFLLQKDKVAEVDMMLKDGWMQAAAEYKANRIANEVSRSGGYCVKIDPGIRTRTSPTRTLSATHVSTPPER